MPSRWCLPIALLVLATARLCAQDSSPPPADSSRLSSLISDLDADDWSARERAQDEIDEIGRPAIPALEAAFAAAPEGERRARLRVLLTDLGVFAWDTASRRDILRRIAALVPAPAAPTEVGATTEVEASSADDAIARLAACGPQALPLILDACDSEPRERRQRAGEAAHRIVRDSPLALNALIHACDDPRWRVRYYAAVGIGESEPEFVDSSMSDDAYTEGESDGEGTTAPPVIEPLPPGPSSFDQRLQGLMRKAILALSALAADPQDGVRWAAARSLTECGIGSTGFPACAALARFLHDRAGEVREMAARGLSRHGSVADAPALVALLKDDADPAVRVAAAWALGQIGDAGSEPALIAALSDREAAVRAHAAGALGHLKNVSGTACLAGLLRVLADEDESVVMAAGESLAARGDASCTDELVRLLREGEGRTRDRAARCLARFGSVAALGPLIDALEDDDSWIRSFAASGLGRLGDPAAAVPLGRLVDGETDVDVRRVAACALGRIGSPEAVGPLVALLGDSMPSIRRHAASALGACAAARSPETIESLTKILSGDSAEAKDGAALALGKLGQAVARDPLLALLKREAAEIESRVAAAWWLGRLGDVAVVPDLTRTMVDDTLDIRIRVHAASSLAALHAPKAVTDVEALARSAPPDQRGTLSGVLLALGSGAGIPLLIADCASGDLVVRSGAAQALRDLCGPDLPPFDPVAKPASTRDARRALLRWWRLHRAAFEKKTSEGGK